MKVLTLLCSFGLLFSCSHKKQAVQQKEKNPQNTPETEKNSAATLKAGAIVLVVKNDTKEKHELSVGWGEHRPFLLYPTKKTAFAQGIAAPIYALDGCSCTGDGNCRKQSQPPKRLIELGPGKTFQYKWDGKIVVWKKSLKEKGERFCVRAAVPPGAHRILACTAKHKCARASFNLPTKQPVVLNLSTAKPLTLKK